MLGVKGGYLTYFQHAVVLISRPSFLYQSNFEDEFGNVYFKLIPRPNITHFLYLYLPLIDKHNKQRQSILNLERKWLANCCWFHLLAMLAGQSIVDFHRLYRSEKKTRSRAVCGQLMDKDGTIIKYSDLLCGKLVQRERNIMHPSKRP
jgi:hypothetical protein